MIIAIRLIRHRGSAFAVPIGSRQEFDSLKALSEWSKKQKKVFGYYRAGDIPVECPVGCGIMRSGRKMRYIDQHVRNTIDLKPTVAVE